MKKTLIMVVAIVLVAALAIGGTFAYLQDSDSDVNVAVVGNVKIEQIELQRKDGVAHDAGEAGAGNGVDKDALVPFEQGQKLYPAYAKTDDAYTAEMKDADLFFWGDYVYSGTAGNGLWDDNNLKGAMDKFVFVKNTGVSDAYFRTLIAFECPEGMDYSEGSDKEFMMNVSGSTLYEWEKIGYVTIDGQRYLVECATYQNALEPGQQSHPSLLQVVMTHNATNEDMELLGDSYEILVISQAVQTENFDNAAAALNAAFGEVTETTAAEWFGDITLVEDAEGLKAALENGEDVYLTKDVTVASTMTVPAGKDATINLNGNDLNYAVSNSGASAIINNKGNLEIEGTGTISFVADNPDLGSIPAYATNTITNTGKLVIGEGVKVTNGSDGGASYAVDNHGEFILNGGTLIGKRCALRVAKYNQDNVYFEMNSGTVEGATPAWIQLPGSSAADAPKISVVINGGTMKSTKDTSADNNVMYTYSYGNSHANTSIEINGGEFLGGTVSIGSGYKGDAPKLTINGGTFEYDVLQWLANDESTVLFKANK